MGTNVEQFTINVTTLIFTWDCILAGMETYNHVRTSGY